MPSLTPRVGDTVRHATLGEGVVLTIERGLYPTMPTIFTVRFGHGANVVSARLLTVLERPTTKGKE